MSYEAYKHNTHTRCASSYLSWSSVAQLRLLLALLYFFATLAFKNMFKLGLVMLLTDVLISVPHPHAVFAMLLKTVSF